MSLYIDFDAHSWYMGFAIEDCRGEQSGGVGVSGKPLMNARWYGVTADGMSGYTVDFEAETLAELRSDIRQYHLKARDGYGWRLARRYLRGIRAELRAENLSYGSIACLQSLVPYIDAGDFELLEAAGVPV